MFKSSESNTTHKQQQVVAPDRTRPKSIEVLHSTALFRWFYHPVWLAKTPKITKQISRITSPQPLFSGRLVKIPAFSRFQYAGTAGQKDPLNLKKNAKPMFGGIYQAPPPWECSIQFVINIGWSGPKLWTM